MEVPPQRGGTSGLISRRLRLRSCSKMLRKRLRRIQFIDVCVHASTQ